MSGKQFYFADSGEEYKHYFFNRTNNYLMTMLGIEMYLITKITSKGYFYRGFCRPNELSTPPTFLNPLKTLKYYQPKLKKYEVN